MLRSSVVCATLACALGDISVDVPSLGTLHGKDAFGDDSVSLFLGIPYAKAPIGDKRWRAPEPHGPWESPRDASVFGPSCKGAGDNGPESEDCLFLNIAAPADVVGDSKAQLPTMIWIHGGSYDSGSGRIYPGQNIVRKAASPVVVATVNYRLNMFGFLGSKELQNRAPESGTGNYGLQDQRLAITWIRDHGAAFGAGGKITLFGESAGGNSLLHHLVQPASRGLFQRLIVESGTYLAGYGVDSAEGIFNGIREQVGCEDLDCLLGKSADELEKAKNDWVQTATLETLHWGPVIDHVSMDASPQDLIQHGKFDVDVDVILGTNRDEFALFAAKTPGYDANMTEEGLDALLASFDKGTIQQVKQVYDPQAYEYPEDLGSYSQYWWTAVRVATDEGLPGKGYPVGPALGHCSARRVVENMLRGTSRPIYMYNFAHPVMGPAVRHADEIPFVFDMEVVDVTKGNRNLAEAMVQFWTSFAATGKPDGPESWPAYSVEERPDMKFDATLLEAKLSLERNFRKSACDFWDQLQSLPLVV